jgi:hypothetical protein
MTLGRKSWSICQCPKAIYPSSFASSSCIVVAAALDVWDGVSAGDREFGDCCGGWGVVGNGKDPHEGALLVWGHLIMSFPHDGCFVRRVGGWHPQLTPDDGAVVVAELAVY